MTVLYLLLFITLAVLISQSLSFRRMLKYVRYELSIKRPEYKPKAAVILPCKGIDPGFEENVTKLLAQDYFQAGTVRFEVVFAVATKDDEAYPILDKLSAASGQVKVKLVVAGINPSRAQKLNNQLAALQHVSDDVEAYAFVDSDMIARPDFLASLIAPLQESNIGATTGYRFYIPYKGDGASVIRSLWNRMSAWELVHPSCCFAWGGAMAIRKETFTRAKVAEHWSQAADDDLSLTTAVKSLGLRVHFVPQCLVASHGDATWAEVIEWTNRQLILTKIYYPQLWQRAIARALVMAIWLVAIMSTIFSSWLHPSSSQVSALFAGLSVLPIELLFLIKGQQLWQEVLHDRRTELGNSFWHFCKAVPLAHLALPWMTLYSLLTNRIQWRGVTYELRSPTETVII